MAYVRKTVTFSGRVQGVGFRYHTYRKSASFDVVGTVQNQPDGTVKMVVEGEGSELDRMIEDISESSPGRISNVDVRTTTAEKNFSGFLILH